MLATLPHALEPEGNQPLTVGVLRLSTRLPVLDRRAGDARAVRERARQVPGAIQGATAAPLCRAECFAPSAFGRETQSREE